MAISTVKMTLDGQTYNLTYDSASGTYKATLTAPAITSWNQPDHKYPVSVTVTDTAGNSVTSTETQFSSLALRVLEKTAPVITTTYPSANAYLSNSKPNIQWKVMDADSGVNPETISIKIDDGVVVTGGITKEPISGGYSCSYTPGTALGEGGHTIYFNAKDNDGNSATQVTVTFTVDTVPPVLNVTSPANGLVTNNKTVTVAGTTSDSISSLVTVTVNGQNVNVSAAGSFSTTVSLTEGQNTITVVATDAAGKSTTITRTVTLDTKAPVITAVTLTPNPVDAGATYIITVTVTD